MEIQSFLLGMGVVLLIVSVIGGVVALVKVNKLKSTVDFFQRERNSEMQNVYHEFEDIRKGMDSRLDKFENKVGSTEFFFDNPERIARIKELINK